MGLEKAQCMEDVQEDGDPASSPIEAQMDRDPR